MRRLIITEGLPCSGKSTSAKFIAERLGWRFVDEGSGDNPADWEFHAFVKDGELPEFSAEQQKVITAGEKCCGGFVVPISGTEGEFFDRLISRKIYDFLPWDTEKPVMLEKWRRFAENQTSPVVLNCVFLQNPMCETMMRFGFPEHVSADYIREIAEIIRPLEPFVVYLKSSNIRQRIEAALPERGEDWLNAVVDYHCGGDYGKPLGLSGFDGYISALEERQRRELRILDSLGIHRIIIEEPEQNWDKAYEKMIAALE